jgi:2-polyprenyl-3-methyl-5-hydroxy-6-metoxy-1,4-benzoquinol methylase
MSDQSKSLLPNQHKEFTSKEYWNSFFSELHEKPFEWYGKTEDVYPFLSRFLQKDSSILIIGCGNSNLSVDLYNKGYQHITNIDYSEVVIEEMKRKYSSSCSLMKWLLGDVTNLIDACQDEQFDIVVDKGTLDAIYSEDNEELKEKSLSMFREISRILKRKNGSYFCISLAQDYILQLLLEYFHSSLWKTDLYYLLINQNQQSVDKQRQSALQPFVFQFTKQKVPQQHVFSNLSSSSSPSSSAVRVHMDSMGNPFVNQNEFLSLSFSKVFSYVQAIQDFYRCKHSLQFLQIGRFETLNFWTNNNSNSSTTSSSSIPAKAEEKGNTTTMTSTSTIPRFSLRILDASEQGKLSIAVFIIPFGREADYQFISKDGLSDIAFQANCKRLIAVACNRPYPYPEMSDLQAQLSPLVLSLKFSSMREDEAIPYMAVNNDRSWEVISQGESKRSGIYIIEEKEEREEEGDGEEGETNQEEDSKPLKGVYRRLIFLENQHFIQTEVHLVSSSYQRHKIDKPKRKGNGSSSSSSKKKKSNKKKKSSSSNEAQQQQQSVINTEVISSSSSSKDYDYLFDFSYLDDHHKGFLLSFCLNSRIIAAFEQKKEANPMSCLLIGLGGGALPMVLQKYYPSLSLTIVELDETVYEIAKNFFHFQLNSSSEVAICEGIKFINSVVTSNEEVKTMKKVNNLPSSLSDLSLNPTSSSSSSLTSSRTMKQYDFIIIDVDCKDPSMGLSAPPKEFITNDVLFKLYSLLSSDGILLINTVARNKELLNQFIDRLKIIFTLCPLKDDEEEEEGVNESHAKGGGNQNKGRIEEGRILQLQANKENVNVCLICMKNSNCSSFFSSSADNGSKGKKIKKGNNNTKELSKNQLEIKLQVHVENNLTSLLTVRFFLLFALFSSFDVLLSFSFLSFRMLRILKIVYN